MESQKDLQSEKKRRKLTKKKATEKRTIVVDQGDESEDQVESSGDMDGWEKDVEITRQTKADRFLRIAEIPAYYPLQSSVKRTAFLIDVTEDAEMAKLLKDNKTSMNKLALSKV
jgi:hypothetical protein